MDEIHDYVIWICYNNMKHDALAKEPWDCHPCIHLCVCKLTPVARTGEAEPAGTGEAWRWGELARSVSYTGLDRKGLCRRPERKHTWNPPYMQNGSEKRRRREDTMEKRCVSMIMGQSDSLMERYRSEMASGDNDVLQKQITSLYLPLPESAAERAVEWWSRGFDIQSKEILNGEVSVCAGVIPGWGLEGAAEGTSGSLGVIPLSLCLNISLGFRARWEMREAASCNKGME